MSPAAGTALTGFSLTMDSTNVFSTSTQVTGRLYASDYSSPTASRLGTAVFDMEAAFLDASGRGSPDYTDLGSGEGNEILLQKNYILTCLRCSSGSLSGLTLTPGLYLWNTAVTMPTDITISGGATDSTYQVLQRLFRLTQRRS